MVRILINESLHNCIVLHLSLLLDGQLSCAFCLHLALALKGIEYETHAVHLLKDGGQQVSFNAYCKIFMWQLVQLFKLGTDTRKEFSFACLADLLI